MCINDKNLALTFKLLYLVSEYTGLFGYIQFGGLLATPFLGLVFDRELLLPKRTKEFHGTAAEKHLKLIHSSILPYMITGVLFILFCVLNLNEHADVQVRNALYFL